MTVGLRVDFSMPGYLLVGEFRLKLAVVLGMIEILLLSLGKVRSFRLASR